MVSDERKAYMRKYMAARRAANKSKPVNSANKVNSELTPADIGLTEADLRQAGEQPVSAPFVPVPYSITVVRVHWGKVPDWIKKRLESIGAVEYI